jgi:hypothetical protein
VAYVKQHQPAKDGGTNSTAWRMTMKDISVSYYKGGKEIIGKTNGVTVFAIVDGKKKEIQQNNMHVNWIR